MEVDNERSEAQECLVHLTEVPRRQVAVVGAWEAMGRGDQYVYFSYFAPHPPMAIGEWSREASIERFHHGHSCVIYGYTDALRISPLLVFFMSCKRNFY